MPSGYRATENPDGTFNIHDVPIFGEVPKGERGNQSKIGKPWLEAALAELQARAAEGYLPPIHFNHHGMDKTERAGHFLATKVEEIVYDGKPMAALLADLVKIPSGKFQAIQAGEYPYRSVEIFDYEKKVINTLALLDDDEPFFRFELLNGDTIHGVDRTFGASIDRETAHAVHVTDEVGFIHSRGGSAALFNFRGGKAMPKPVDHVLNIEDGKPVLFVDGKPVTFELGSGVHFQEDDENDDEKKIEAKIAKLQAALKALRKKHGADKDDEKKPAEPDKDKAKHSAEDDEDKDKGGKHAAAQEGRIAALEQRLEARDATDAAGTLADGAIAKLKADGFHVSDKTSGTIHAFAAKGKDELELFEDSFRLNARKDGKDNLEDYSDTTTAEAKTFQAQGPEALEKAETFAAEYDELTEHGYGPTGSKKDFIARRMVGAGFKAAS